MGDKRVQGYLCFMTPVGSRYYSTADETALYRDPGAFGTSMNGLTITIELHLIRKYLPVLGPSSLESNQLLIVIADKDTFKAGGHIPY